MHTLSIVLRCCEFSTQLFHFQLLCSILKKTIDMACPTPQDLDLYHVVEKNKNEIHQCGIPSTSWILGNKEPFVGLQNLCDSDLYV